MAEELALSLVALSFALEEAVPLEAGALMAELTLSLTELALSLAALSSVLEDPLLIEAGAVPLEAGAVPLEAGAVPLEAGAVPLEAGAVPLEAGSLASVEGSAKAAPCLGAASLASATALDASTELSAAFSAASCTSGRSLERGSWVLGGGVSLGACSCARAGTEARGISATDSTISSDLINLRLLSLGALSSIFCIGIWFSFLTCPKMGWLLSVLFPTLPCAPFVWGFLASFRASY
jgi:hypothetical protein